MDLAQIKISRKKLQNGSRAKEAPMGIAGTSGRRHPELSTTRSWGLPVGTLYLIKVVRVITDHEGK